MQMITYRATQDRQTTKVLLAGKLVGHITESRKGFRYTPRGSSVSGELSPTLAECKASLESPANES